ncbi:hypothetical protein [Spiroplasma monobiae]|uniref:Lipoprotein n=1 Tax=Spiroplasma monobiae MQ-1 TaxID=1336748 RepID=A0A2K9LT62_SPISQ|nr:hypothetical protein [Spiroplasma monobiae]AUM62279.1 hypothetical protein SMONO_v1c00260 [Spiroplasma monobiae MQ-1]
MKKLLSVLGTFAIVTPGISAVASCGISTNSIKTLVDNDKEFKIGDETVGYSKVFGSNSTLSVLGYQVLDALTFTEDKYPGKDNPKKQKQKDVLGDTGLAMALTNANKEEQKQDIKFSGDAIEDFVKDYNEPVDSNFTEVNFNLGITNKEIKEGEKWSASKATTFNSNDAKTIQAEVKYQYKENGNLDKTTIDHDTSSSETSLEDYLSKTWSTEKANVDWTKGLSEYKDKPYYAMSSDDAEKMYSAILKEDEKNQEELLGNPKVNLATFKNDHTKLTSSKTRYENGILMPGQYNLPGNADKQIKDFNEEIKSQDISGSSVFYRNKDKNALQSQVVGGYDNENRTFMYSKSTSPLKIDFTFTMPEDKKREREEVNYKIEITLNNLIVGYQLVGVNLETEIKDKKIESAKNVYWYEPAFYQFTNKEMFRISSNNVDGTTDVFKDLKGATINISKKTK